MLKYIIFMVDPTVNMPSPKINKQINRNPGYATVIIFDTYKMYF